MRQRDLCWTREHVTALFSVWDAVGPLADPVFTVGEWVGGEVPTGEALTG